MTKRYRVKIRNIVMGVPITFLDKYCPNQFEIVGASVDSENTLCHIQKDYTKLGYKFFKQDGSVSGSGALRDKMSPKIPVKGKSDYSLSPDGSVLSALYSRIFIRKKPKKTRQYHIKIRNIVMGVPITFLGKYCPKQFCIIGHEHDLEGTGESEGAVGGQFMVQKKGMYKRILIRKKPKKTRQYRVKVRNIVMGVPITFLDKYNPKQFEILGLLNSSSETLAGIPIIATYDNYKEIKQDGSFTKSSGKKTNGNPVLKGKPKKGNYYINEKQECVYSCFSRIVIRRK